MPENESAPEFEQAGRDQQGSLFRELLQFIVENEKWWLLSIMLTMGVFELMAMLATTGAGPFTDTLF